MMWQLLIWMLVMAGIGAGVAVLWMMSIRQSAERQRQSDMQELRMALQREQAAAYQAGRWREDAHRNEVEMAYLHGKEAGRNEQQCLPPASPVHPSAKDKGLYVSGRVYTQRPPVGRG